MIAAEPSASPAWLAKLTARQREAMLARMGRGHTVMPQVDVAAELNITQPAVSRRIARGLERLRDRGMPAESVAALKARLGLT
ncbi:MAG: hypothetical protein JWO31_4284 [Phycisphaerales bacterium]|nr:hypothetical protein [Phycisphaerales bacterium]